MLAKQHVQPVFFDILETITNKRIIAKKTKDKTTAETLKITIIFLRCYCLYNMWILILAIVSALA